MFIKQVSVFVENKNGKLLEVIDLLGKNNIDISALSIADTENYGVLRIIVDKPQLATEVLKQNNYIVKINDVIAITIDNKPGGLSHALKVLNDNDIDVSYLYAFVNSKTNCASVMLKVSDVLKALELFKKNDIVFIKAEDIQNE